MQVEICLLSQSINNIKKTVPRRGQLKCISGLDHQRVVFFWRPINTATTTHICPTILKTICKTDYNRHNNVYLNIKNTNSHFHTFVFSTFTYKFFLFELTITIWVYECEQLEFVVEVKNK